MKPSLTPNFTIGSKLALFFISYFPLLLIMLVKTITANWDYFHWSGLGYEAIKCYFRHFTWFTLLLFISVVSILGIVLTWRNIERNSDNGYYYCITNIQDVRPESINYLATYVFPFVFEENNFINIFSILILFLVFLVVTIKTDLIIINPILSIFIGVYKVETNFGDKVRMVYVLSKGNLLVGTEFLRETVESNTAIHKKLVKIKKIGIPEKITKTEIKKLKSATRKDGENLRISKEVNF